MPLTGGCVPLMIWVGKVIRAIAGALSSQWASEESPRSTEQGAG